MDAFDSSPPGSGSLITSSSQFTQFSKLKNSNRFRSSRGGTSVTTKEIAGNDARALTSSSKVAMHRMHNMYYIGVLHWCITDVIMKTIRNAQSRLKS